MRAMIRDTHRKQPEVGDQQNHDALPDHTLICQPIAPMSKEIRTGGSAIEMAFLNRQGPIVQAHLPVGKLFAQRKAGRELIGCQGKHNHAWAGTFFEQSPQTEIPVQIVSLFDPEPAYLVLTSQAIVQTV